ncbi:MAG: PD-(D/E)XK nuclease family protein [Actinomycetota bacterium]|nr:PD-(D/E)XK nuclease family protein [Actinomycetota bacterium]
MLQFPEVEHGDAVRISATTFALFEQCPDSANARLLGNFGPDTRPAFSGGLAHRIFARHLSRGPIPAEALSQACREEIGCSILNVKLGSLGLKPSSLGQVVEEVGELYDRFRKMPVEGFAGAEVRLEVEAAADVILLGSVDAVFEGEADGDRLVDWKTGELGDLVVSQLRFYALLWGLDRGRLPERVEAVSVGTGERVSEVPSSSQLIETAGRVAEMVNLLRRSWARGLLLERRGGPWCRYCPLLEGCEEGEATIHMMGGRSVDGH